MILIDDGNTELGRSLRETMPAGVELRTEPGEYSISAFPTVIVDVPAYGEDRPLFGEQGEFLGMSAVTVPAHQESLRMPASWEAVASFAASVEERALLRPAV